MAVKPPAEIPITLKGTPEEQSMARIIYGVCTTRTSGESELVACLTGAKEALVRVAFGRLRPEVVKEASIRVATALGRTVNLLEAVEA